MRFAYIDSQGNEVPIPSVDALALRIELGAIGPDTQLYDAQADYWGPASTHEIFHTLSREREEEGFVAPPPPVPPPSVPAEEPLPDLDAAPDAEVPPSAGPDAGAEATDAVASTGPDAAAAADEAGSTDPDAPAVETAGDFPSFDLVEGTGTDAPADEAAADEGAPDFDFGDLSLASDEEEEEPAVESASPESLETDFPSFDTVPPMDLGAVEAPEDDVAEGAFDFGGMDTLELEASEPQAEAPPAYDPGGGLGGGMELEEPLSGGMDLGGGGDLGGGLELETPMSEFSAEEPPAWMEQGGPAGEGEGALDFSAPSADEAAPPPREEVGEAAEEVPRRPRREPPTRHPRSRPSPPRRRRSKGPLVAGIAAVAVLGGGGYFGFQWWSNRPASPAAEEEAPQLPPVTIPDIPAELLPTMRDLAEDALAGMVRTFEGMQAELDLPAEPRAEWLSGAYLGQASRFPDIEEYWLGIEAFVDRVRSVDTQVFHDQYVAAVERAGIDEETAALLIERADSGFLATRIERFEAYNQMDDLVNAALNLHDFLVANEEDIAYEPAAAGVARDPVLEAVPATEALGREMWEMVDHITDALDALGTLDRVTTERLFAVLFDRVRRAGIE